MEFDKRLDQYIIPRMVQEGTTHLPKEVEFAAKREQLSNLLQQLADSAETNPYNDKVKLIHNIYFADNEEVFGISFVQVESLGLPKKGVEITLYKTRAATLHGMISDGKTTRSSEAPVTSVIEYDPPAHFTVVYEDDNGNLSQFGGVSVETIDEIDGLVSTVDFMVASLPNETSRQHPIKDIPESLKRLVARVRETKRMRFEYKLPEFYEVLKRVSGKAEKMEDVDETAYEAHGSVVIASTGWVKVEKEEEVFELKFDLVDAYMNGDYSEVEEIARREEGDPKSERDLFSSIDVNPLSILNPIRTEETLQECIDILELLDKAIPEPAKT